MPREDGQTHTVFSADALTPPEADVRRRIERKIAALAVTDYPSIASARAAERPL